MSAGSYNPITEKNGSVKKTLHLMTKTTAEPIINLDAILMGNV